MPAAYTITEELYQGRKHSVHRAIRERDKTPVIIKSLLAEVATTEQLASLRREHEILSTLDIDGVVKAHELRERAASLDLVLEDAGGETLARYARSPGFDLIERLRLAVRIAEVLAAVHRAGVIHKDITPRNILVRPASAGITLIDFSISTRQSEEHQAVSHPRLLEGTPAYLSPEQTGRMNRPIDYRTDFYSLGATLFELFAGQVPFETLDSVALIHSHLAVPAPSVGDIRPEIPPSVCAVVEKLLQKAPEDRYHSALGLVEDLRYCLETSVSDDEGRAFVAGVRDVPDRFLISRRLYGRDTELETLLQAFARIRRGGSEFVLVSGYSGIGKSSLVGEGYKPITEHNGHFVTGKFDQLRRAVPYAAIVGAITGLVRQLLAETDESLADWKAKLVAALAGNGQLLIDMIPEVERVIGPQPSVEVLHGLAERDRFATTFQAFIGAFCSRAHPLAIFLDDLQWADEASLTLMASILGDEDTQYLLLIGAYRDNEVDDAHPLTAAVEAIKGRHTTVTEVHLDPLESTDVTALLSDTLHSDSEAVQSLADLVARKTAGNPFFLRQFLITLWREEQLTFDYDLNRWAWDISSIEAMNITDNVVDLMVTRLKKLPEESQAVLRLAACIGNRFELRTLEVIQKDGAGDALANLRPAIDAGLVLTSVDASQLAPDGTDSARKYRFLHDRVHQAAYLLIDEPLKRTVHLEIGQQLLASVSEATTSDQLFEVVDHLNVGRGLLKDVAGLSELAELNLAAASRAVSATAYDAAIVYATEGLECAGEDAWLDDYELAKALHRAHANAAYLSGDFEGSQRVIDGMLEEVKTGVEQAELHNLLVVQQTLTSQYAAAIDTAVTALSVLGVDLPTSRLDEALEHQLERYRLAMGNRRPSDLLDVPAATSREIQVAFQLLGSVCPLCIIAHPELFRVAATLMVNLSLDHGHTLDSSIGYAFFGLVQSSFLHNYEAAYEFGRLALDLSENSSSASHKCRTAHVFCAFINHWTRPLREFGPINSEGFRAGVQSGELQFAGYHRYNRALCLYHQGDNLSDLQLELVELARFSRKTRNEHATDPVVAVERTVLELTAQTPRPGSFDADDLDDRGFLERLGDRNAVPALCHYNVMKSQVFYLYGQLDEARSCAAAAAAQISFVSGHISVAVQNFYESLILVAIASSEKAPEQSKLLDRVRQNQGLMESWADSCPANFAHKFLLVRAELARLAGDHWRAADLYDEAIEVAGDNEYRQEEALARELAGQFWLARGRRKIAAMYLREAHHGYRLWGAVRKADLLEQAHGDLLEGARGGQSQSTEPAMPYLTLVSSTGAALDFSTIMKATRAISAEIDLSLLVQKLVRIAVENAGAQRGCLLLQRGEDLYVEAESAFDAGELRLAPPKPFDATDLPSGVVNYAVRTQEVVVVSDAASDPTFGSDPYVRENRPKSILCVPIVKQSQLLGLLYLEHNLATNVFTEDRVGILESLAAQAAVSLEHSKLYEKQTRTELMLRETLSEVEDLKGRLEAENLYLQEEIKLNHNFEEIIGKSPAIKQVLETVETVAPTNANVLITGETGTGKELIARAVHDLSERSGRPLIKVNCATISKDLFESEFFGHVKGAFTGALKSRAGRFALADGGTLFLDEVAEIPIEMQSKLLRVLQERQFERVGGERTHDVDVRIIAATNRDLDAEVEHGRFRQDLYYRLNVFPIHVAPLRERCGDIPALAAHFIQLAATEMMCPPPDLRGSDVEGLKGYGWPGNVRELQNVIERAVIASRTGPVRFDVPNNRHLAQVGPEDPAVDLPRSTEATSLAALEKEHILRVLASNDHNKSKTARDLGIDPKTLYKRLREYGILPPPRQ